MRGPRPAGARVSTARPASQELPPHDHRSRRAREEARRPRGLRGGGRTSAATSPPSTGRRRRSARPHDWPQSLVSVVRVLLTSRFSMWMAWGPELTFFCNDAYRRDTLGAKYPWALGRPAREVWAEIWPEIGPRIDRVMATGEATWDEALLLFLERSGYSGGDLPHLLVQPPDRRRRQGRRHALRGQRGHRAGHRCPADGDGARPRRRASRRCAARRRCSPPSPRSSPRTGGRCRWGLVYLFDDGRAKARPPCCRRPRACPPAPGRGARGRRGRPGRRLAGGRRPARGAPCSSATCRTGSPDVPTGAWAEPPLRALAVPLRQQGDCRPTGSWSSASTATAQLDADYQGFVELLADQIAAASPARGPTRRSASGPSGWSSSTGPRPSSSPTSATSSAPR